MDPHGHGQIDQPELLVKDTGAAIRIDPRLGRILWLIGIGLILFLCLYRLTDYPTTWYDEGSHLHVPKTFVKYGVYADISSEGFRYYGPTNGVGPTVMLPIAAVFRVFGIGLFQARLVMAAYLILAITLFYRLIASVFNRSLAVVSTLLLVGAPGVSLFEYGRQALGEVPGMAFLLAGLWVWFSGWEKKSWKSWIWTGVLFGLSTVTKNQYLLVIAPTLGLAWLANWFYYKQVPHKAFILPGLITAGLYGVWQMVVIFLLGPGSWSENLATLAAATGGAAFVFSWASIQRAVGSLFGPPGYFGLLILALVYAIRLFLPKTREGQLWNILWILVVANLAWYAIASIGWLRYAFPGFMVGVIFLAQGFMSLTGGYRLILPKPGKLPAPELIRLGAMALLAVLIAVPFLKTAYTVLFPGDNYPVQMAKYLDANVPISATIETWEPELGFLTDHRYHYPPQALLAAAVDHIWTGGPPPAESYDFSQAESADYLLVGGFSTWVGLYNHPRLAQTFDEVIRIGPFTLYQNTGRDNPSP